jgi:1-acyl-sn-glycerol-3-phosphate acyltransferase
MKKLKIFSGRISELFYNIPRFLLIHSYRLCISIRIFNPKKMPEGKPVIFAFNHTTGADPIIVLGALRKKIYFVAASSNFKNKFTNFFMRRFGNSIPVFKDQFSKNIKSFKELFVISKKNKVFLGIFPEGELNRGKSFKNFKGGTAYLSFKTKLPIIPVYIHNLRGPNEKSWFGRNDVPEGILSLVMNTFRRINLFIGEPIDPMAENIVEDLKEITDKNVYKKAIEIINNELEKEFCKLRDEADNLFAKKSFKEKIKPADINIGCPGDEDAEEELFGESFSDDGIVGHSNIS